MGKMIVDGAFYMKKVKERVDPAYVEYRRKWNENPKNHTVERFPIHVDLESTSVCNYRCKMCFQSLENEKIDKGYMDFNLFKKIIDEGAEKGLCSIKLQFRGEPLLHPKIVEMVKYAKDSGMIEVMFNTNASLLDEKMAKGLIDAHLDRMICSLDAATKETYESIRTGGKWENVLDNIKGLMAMKKKMGVDYPIVRAQIVDTPWNHDEVRKFIEFWGGIVDEVSVTDMKDHREGNTKGDLIWKDFECAQIWQRLFIRWDGTVTLCCGDHYAKYKVGDANKDTIESIWKSLRVEAVRKMHMAGDSHKLQMCRECGMREAVINAHLKPKQ